MSQEKVERYKAEKLNRKEILKRKKRQSIIAKCLMCLVALALVGLIGYGIYYSAVVNSGGTNANTVNIDALNDYFEGLDVDVAMSVFEEETTDDEEAADVSNDTAGEETADTESE